jgi:N-acyl-L-homoserine lactone synthetase
LREGRTQELWQKCGGFLDLSIWELYADVYDSLPKCFSPHQKIIADILVSWAGNDSCTERRILYVGQVTEALSIGVAGKGCKTDARDSSRAILRGMHYKTKNMRLENVGFRGWDEGMGLAPYPDGVFECILSIHALHGQREIGATISEYFRVLKPSGRLILVEQQCLTCEHAILEKVHDGGVQCDINSPLSTRFDEGICNLPQIRSKENSGNSHSTYTQLRGKLDDAGFRLDCLIPVDSPDSEFIATALKPRYYLETSGYKFLSAETREDLEKVFRLRYQVYCVELGVEPKNDSGLQRDVYDEYAVHFLALDENDKPVGTLRAVPNNHLGFPMEADFLLTEYMKANGILKAVDVGRFAIHRDVPREGRVVIALGLFKCLGEFCEKNEINDLFATTQLKLAKRYEVNGFRQIGEPFEYPEALSGVLWIPMHCDARKACDSHFKNLRGHPVTR